MIRRSVLAFAALLSACAAPRSPIAVQPIAPAALGLVGSASPAIDAEWWRAFGDPQLDRLIADALAGNPTLDQALARLRQAQAVLSRSQAERRPDVALNAEPQIARLSDVYTIPPPYAGTVRFVGTATANLGWNLDLFGRQRAAIEQAGRNVAAVRLDLAAARLAIAGSVAQSYVDLARSEQQAAIARKTVDTRQQSVKLVQAQVRNQLASQLQLTAADTLLAQARQASVAADGARILATNALAALAGRGPDYAAAIGPTAFGLDAALALPAAVPLDLIARRPDLAAARNRIEAAAAGRQVARRAFYPNVDLRALAGFQAIGVGNLFSLAAGMVGVGPAVHLPLFDSGLTADLENASGTLDLATAQYNERVVGAVREAADAIAAIASLGGQRAQSRQVVQGFTDTNRLNAVRVRSGLDSKLDLIDADVRLLDARLQDINLAADQAGRRIALVLALGGGFDPSQDNIR